MNAVLPGHIRGAVAAKLRQIIQTQRESDCLAAFLVGAIDQLHTCASDTVYTVFVDGNEQWYGTFRGAGYHSTEFTKSDWITYTRTEGLICDSVYAIAKDLSGNMWFGTPKGVSKLSISPTDTTWTNYTTKDGLVADKVNTIAADIDGSVWFGTDKGISHFKSNIWEKF